MSTLANVLQVLTVLVNPTAPVTGAIVDRVAASIGSPIEQTYTLQVDAFGEGTTYERAIENAKVKALENAVGQFIINEKHDDNGKFRTTTSSYTGGVIKQYNVLSHINTPGSLHYVAIEVIVVLGKNNTVTSKVNNNVYVDDGSTQGIVDDIEKRAEFVRQLEKQPMYNVDVTYVEKTVNQTNQFVNLKVNYTVRLSEKYIDDFKTLASHIGVPLVKGQPHTYAVCFNHCMDLGQQIPSVSKPLYFIATVNMKDGRKVKHEFNISNHQHLLMRTYRNHGVSLIENAHINTFTTVRMTTADALQMKSVTFEAVGMR